MLRTKSLRAALLLPATLAIALVSQTPTARADAAKNAQLVTILKGFAAQEGKSASQVAAVTTASASADDLVFAVYTLAQDTTLTSTDLGELVDGALVSTGKARADKDKVVGRLVEAAIIGAGAQADSAKVTAILNKALASTSGGKALTAAGKELAVAKALRASKALGTDIATAANTAIGAAATEKVRTAFLLAVAKDLSFKPQTEDPTKSAATKGTFFPVVDGNELTVVGEPAFVEGAPSTIIGPNSNLVAFIDKALDSYLTADSKKAAALAIAQGVTTIPSVAGAVIGGYAKDLKTGSATPAAGDAAIQSFLLASVANNSKLAKVLSDSVADSFRLFEAATDKVADAIALAGATTSATSRAAIAGGAIRGGAATTTTINGVIALPTKPITQAGLAAFAGGVAVGNAAAAADIFNAVLDKYTPTTQATEATKFEAIADAVIKAVAATDPDAAGAVGQRIFAVTRTGSGITANPFNAKNADGGDTARLALVKALAKGASTNYTAAGALVAGVVHGALTLGFGDGDVTTPAQAEALASAYAISAISGATKAAQSITYKVTNEAAVRAIYGGSLGTSSVTTLATKIATGATTSVSGAVAAGAALSDTKNAGKIAAAIINIDAKRNAAALTIANTVAIQVDVEAIGLIAKEVGALFQPVAGTAGSKYPKLTSIGTLATSLGKAINTKPFTLWQNRVDELGELAAQLVDVAVSKGSTDAKTFGSIGAAVFKAASAKLLANALNNAADLSDIVQDVAGSIAQSIASSTVLTTAQKDAIFAAPASDKKSLLYALTTAGKTAANKAAIATAFTQVLSARTVVGGANVYGTYIGGPTETTTDASGNTSTSTYEKGATYEFGTVTDPETRIKNI